MTAALAPPDTPKAASPARVEANRRNALKSTGPKTDEGKKRAKMNALKHGLTAASDASDREDDARRDRREALLARLGSADSWDRWAADHVAMLSNRVDLAGRMIWAALAETALRAEDADAWVRDRTRDASVLGASIHRDPTGVVCALMESPWGIDWMIDRWELLRYAAVAGQGWTEEEGNLAFDLMQTPTGSRWMTPEAAFRLVEGGGGPLGTLSGVAEGMIGRLLEARPAAVELDELRRLQAAAGATDLGHAEVRRLQRYEGELFRRIKGLMFEIAARDRGALDPESVSESGSTARAETNPTLALVGPRNEPNPAAFAPPPANETKPIPQSPSHETNPTVSRPGLASTLKLVSAEVPVASPASSEPEPEPETQPAPAKKDRPDLRKLAKRERRRRRRA